MEISLFLAKILGLCLVIICLGVLINRNFFFDTWRDFAKHPILIMIIMLSGIFDLILGLLVLLFHNVWAWDWRVLITLLGWIFTVRGCVRILFPQFVMENAARVLNSRFKIVLNVGIVLFLFIGLFLTYKGFWTQPETHFWFFK